MPRNSIFSAKLVGFVLIRVLRLTEAMLVPTHLSVFLGPQYSHGKKQNEPEEERLGPRPRLSLSPATMGHREFYTYLLSVPVTIGIIGIGILEKDEMTIGR